MPGKPLYRSIESLNYSFWSRIGKSTSVSDMSLSFFRILLCLFLLLFYAPNYSWISTDFQAFFSPPPLTLAYLFNRFPGKTFFVALDLLLLCCLVLMLLGIKTRFFSIAFVIGNVVGMSFQFAFGKIDHSYLAYILVLCLAFSGWSKHLAVLPERNLKHISTAKSLGLFAVILCFAMFTAGYEKAIHWLDLDLGLSGFAAWFYPGFYSLDRHFLLAPYVFNIDPAYFEAFDYVAVIFELSPFFFLLYSRKVWLSWLLIASIFHLVNTLILNITFVNQSLVYLVFIDFTLMFRAVKNLLSKVYFLVFVSIGLAAAVAGRVIRILNAEHSINLFFPESQMEMTLYLAVMIWLLAIILISWSMLKSRTSPLVSEAALS